MKTVASFLGSLLLLLAGPLRTEASRFKTRKGTVACSPGGAAPCKCNCAAPQQASSASMGLGLPGMPGVMGGPGMAAVSPAVPPPQAPPPPLLPPPPPPPPPLPAEPVADLPPLPKMAPLVFEDLPTLGHPSPQTLPPTGAPLPVLATMTVPPPPTQPPFPYAQAAATLTVAQTHQMAAGGGVKATASVPIAQGKLTHHYYQYVPGFGYFMIPGTPGETNAAGDTAGEAAGEAATTAKISKKGCACLQEWSLDGKDCTNYCCNPDGAAGDWCFVEDEGCEGDTWGLCGSSAALLQVISNSSRGLKLNLPKVMQKSGNLRASFLQERQDNVDGAECDCEA